MGPFMLKVYSTTTAMMADTLADLKTSLLHVSDTSRCMWMGGHAACGGTVVQCEVQSTQCDTSPMHTAGQLHSGDSLLLYNAFTAGVYKSRSVN